MARFLQYEQIPMLWDIKFDKVIRKGAWMNYVEFVMFCILCLMGAWYYFELSLTLTGKIAPMAALSYSFIVLWMKHWNDLKNYQHLILYFHYLIFCPKVYKTNLNRKDFVNWRKMWESIVIDLTWDLKQDNNRIIWKVN